MARIMNKAFAAFSVLLFDDFLPYINILFLSVYYSFHLQRDKKNAAEVYFLLFCVQLNGWHYSSR